MKKPEISVPAEEEKTPRAGKVCLLSLDPAMSMSDQEVADRAMMAISFVAEAGYARKNAASDSIVEHLGIREFAEAQEGDYKSVQGSMRALTMALWKKWRYIERVRCSNRRGKGFSESIRAYRITEKGEKRIELIKDRFGENAKSLMNPLWRRSSGGDESGISAASVAESVSPTAASSGIKLKGMSEFKKMASIHDEAEKQIGEIDAVIEATNSDIRLLKIELEGLESVEIERKKKIQELQEDLARVAIKKEELAESIRKKEEERSDWEAAKAPHEAERRRVESLMGFSEG